jgi:fatty acid desaturase
MKNLGIYVIASLMKTIFWLILLIIDFSMISPKDDLAIALTLGLIWVFLLLWWVSYFLFYWAQWLFTTKISKERMQKDAYKTSFLFWLFCLINVLLLIAELWTKWLWIICLILFIIMQYAIFTDPLRRDNARTLS